MKNTKKRDAGLLIMNAIIRVDNYKLHNALKVLDRLELALLKSRHTFTDALEEKIKRHKCYINAIANKKH